MVLMEFKLLQIFTVVITCGLFHGLIFLPVLLSILGPEPYPFAYSREDDEEFESKPGLKIVEMKPLRNLPLDGSGVCKVVKTDPNNFLPQLFSTNNAPLLVDSRDIQTELTQH